MTDRPQGWSLASEGYNRVIKLDYFGNEYEAWELKPDTSRRDLWQAFRDMQAKADKYFEGVPGGLTMNISKQNTLIEIENGRL